MFPLKRSLKRSLHFLLTTDVFAIPNLCLLYTESVHIFPKNKLPTMNGSTVLNQNTWGVHFNFEGRFTSLPTSPAWLTSLHQRDWQCRGIVVWDPSIRVVAHLYAGNYSRCRQLAKKLLQQRPAFAPILNNISQVEWLEGNHLLEQAQVTPIKI